MPQAYPRAEQEEKDCCRKASSRMIYLNLAVNKIKKLRAEKAAAPAKLAAAGASGADVGKRNMLTTHMQVWRFFLFRHRPSNQKLNKWMLVVVLRCSGVCIFN